MVHSPSIHTRYPNLLLTVAILQSSSVRIQCREFFANSVRSVRVRGLLILLLAAARYIFACSFLVSPVDERWSKDACHPLSTPPPRGGLVPLWQAGKTMEDPFPGIEACRTVRRTDDRRFQWRENESSVQERCRQ